MSYKSSYNPYTYLRFNWEMVLTLTLKKKMLIHCRFDYSSEG